MHKTVETVYLQLKKDITLAHYAPGEALNVRDIAERLSVSPTPVREALVRLETEGHVQTYPGKGAYVSEISLQHFKDITETRLFLLNLLGRLAVRRITDQEISELEKIASQLGVRRNRNEILDIALRFHQALHLATKNQDLVGILANLHEKVSRLWFFIPDEVNQPNALLEEYQAIVAALRKRDEKECIRALRKNKLRFVQLVQEALLEDGWGSVEGEECEE